MQVSAESRSSHENFGFPYLPVSEVVLGQALLSQAEPGARINSLHHVVAGSLPSVDMKNLSRHKAGAIEVKHGVDNIGHISHPTHWMECRQSLIRFGRVHRSLDDSW